MTWASRTSGCYGGDISTPNLDKLAAGGLRFTQFYNTSRCWPSRAAILTGYYAQQVRRDTVPGVKSGGNGVRPSWALLLPEMLKPLGYRSYHSGKWHMDGKPLQNGFDHSYDLEDHNRNFAPQSHLRGRSEAAAGQARQRILHHHRLRRSRHQVPEGARGKVSRQAFLRVSRLHRPALSAASAARGHRAIQGQVSEGLGRDPRGALEPHDEDGDRPDLAVRSWSAKSALPTIFPRT